MDIRIVHDWGAQLDRPRRVAVGVALEVVRLDDIVEIEPCVEGRTLTKTRTNNEVVRSVQGLEENICRIAMVRVV